MSLVAASASPQASTDSIETEGVRFGTGASIGAITERMRITQDGLVGIGTSTPTANLTVSGTISATNAIQIGMSALACAAPVSGSVRYSILSDTLQVCTSSGWKSLVSGSIAGSSSPASNTGAIQFNSNNTFAGDTDKLFWSAATSRLGIGTGTPASTVEISASGSSNYISVRNAAVAPLAAGLAIYTSTTHNGFLQFYYPEKQWRFFAGGVGGLGDVKMTVSPFGVGVGTAVVVTPTATLQVSGSFIVSSSAQTSTPSLYVGLNGFVGVGTSAPTAALHVIGDVAYTGVMSDVSDRRMKRDIIPLSDSVAEHLMKLEPVTFKMKDVADTEYGFIAQDVQEVFPELVRDGEILSLNYVGLIAPVVKTIQLLKRENDEQADRINALGEQNRLLRQQVKELMLEVRKAQRDPDHLMGRNLEKRHKH